MSERYPFVDLRPTLKHSRGRWEALGEDMQRLLERDAVISGVRLEIVDDEPEEAKT